MTSLWFRVPGLGFRFRMRVWSVGFRSRVNNLTYEVSSKSGALIQDHDLLPTSWPENEGFGSNLTQTPKHSNPTRYLNLKL